MRTFYVRPQTSEGYGSGDGTSYDNAWNGLQAVDWSALAAGDPAALWVCGDPRGPGGFVTVFVEMSYLKSPEIELEPAPARAVPGRESAQPV